MRERLLTIPDFNMLYRHRRIILAGSRDKVVLVPVATEASGRVRARMSARAKLGEP